NLLSMVGFKGSYFEGRRMLSVASAATETWRSFGAQLILSTYECYVEQMFNVRTIDAPCTAKHIESGLQKNSLVDCGPPLSTTATLNQPLFPHPVDLVPDLQGSPIADRSQSATSATRLREFSAAQKPGRQADDQPLLLGDYVV